MNELARIVADMETVFESSNYPKEFLEKYDQMECLASHTGRETFLVQRKSDGQAAVAACFDRAVFPFQPDIGLLKELKAPGLPEYYEEFRNDRMLCIVREYIEGESLDQYAREKQLSQEEITGIAEQLCDILQVLHSHQPPVVHRDIKPENIIVRPDGRIVLIDFDIARSVKEGAEADTVFFGTRGYAPPEQYGFGQTDSRADIYAFGVLLRWLVTGIVRENRNISMDPALQEIIDRCTAFSPEERYGNIKEVKAALDGARSSAAQGRAPRGIFRIGWKKAAGLLLAAVLFLLAGFAAGRYTDWLKPAVKIVFREPLIEEAARLQLGKERGPLTEEDLQQVDKLYIFGTEAFADFEQFSARDVAESTEGPIRTLDDLKLLPNLTEVHIAHQSYVDAAGAAGMAKLHTVELKHMRLTGAAPIGDVPGLRHAVLFACGLSDVTPLENCPWLETLDIGLNDITSLSQVGEHPNVRSLGFMWLKMDNVDDIAQRLPKVQAVTLQHGEIKDLSGLAALPDLEAVYVLEEQKEEAEKLFAGTGVQVNVTEN